MINYFLSEYDCRYMKILLLSEIVFSALSTIFCSNIRDALQFEQSLFFFGFPSERVKNQLKLS